MRSPNHKRDILIALAVGAIVALFLIITVSALADGLSHANCNH